MGQPVKPHKRRKESTAQRRARRQRGEARVFDRLLKACRAVASHHPSSSRLVGCLRQYLTGSGHSHPSCTAQVVRSHPAPLPLKRHQLHLPTARLTRRPPTPPPPSRQQLAAPLIAAVACRQLRQEEAGCSGAPNAGQDLCASPSDARPTLTYIT